MDEKINAGERGGVPAEERCAFCGAGIREAGLQQAIVRDGEVICRDCAPRVLADAIAQARKIKARAMTAVIIAAVLMFTGLFSAYTGVGRPAGAPAASALLAIVFFFGMAVMPSVWYGALEKGPGSPLLLPGAAGKALRFAVRMGLAFALGIFLAPASVLQNLKNVKQLDAQIAGCESLLNNRG